MECVSHQFINKKNLVFSSQTVSRCHVIRREMPVVHLIIVELFPRSSRPTNHVKKSFNRPVSHKMSQTWEKNSRKACYLSRDHSKILFYCYILWLLTRNIVCNSSNFRITKARSINFGWAIKQTKSVYSIFAQGNLCGCTNSTLLRNAYINI